MHADGRQWRGLPVPSIQFRKSKDDWGATEINADLESLDQHKFENAIEGIQSQKSLEKDQLPSTISNACSVLSNLDCQKKEKNYKPKARSRDKHDPKNKTSTSTNVRRNLGCKKNDCRLIEKIHKEKWWINNKKSSKKKFNHQQIKALDNGESESEDISEEIIADDAIVLCSGSHTLGWSGVHLKPKENVSICKKRIKEAKLKGVYELKKSKD